jgi:hypothetical protein
VDRESAVAYRAPVALGRVRPAAARR